MKIEISGSPKEIAALVSEVQERQEKEKITFKLKLSNVPISEKGNEIVVDEKELDEAMENLPENPYQPVLWVDEHGEVVVATSSDVLKFRKRKDARYVFALIERLFDGIEGGNLA